ncbi:ATP-grasp domain-containing protein [Chiayiivirga flava]|uniref:Glutathione synthase/RimK-type ligase-like ATP-grasp enzyme n=1 Tax=Chiayiivirga flava TaxID=659595 RepID=A0A7W8D9A2_9GAMM|nr:hypothetical protein [Chiayiivirga flava]MBB5209147.1 glutathione synthase/RimK-type ligase-like ATP-grasp enzyme [Chiayiivirga flava]
MPTLALATAIAAAGLDDDMPPLLDACLAAGIDTHVVAWDDPTVSWARFDAVLLRSTWDYTQRLPAFLAWCDCMTALTTLLNPLPIVRWNTDKHYLADLAAAGVPTVPSAFVEPGQAADAFPDHDEFVVKPTVSAGSRDTQRYVRAERAAAVAHAQRLLDAGRAVVVQPYLHAVDEAGETALLFFDGRFSHAIRKGPLLARGADATRALFAAEHITARTPSDEEKAIARRALDAIPHGRPLYARVDLLPSPAGPQLLELELTEPSLFLATAAGAAARFAELLAARLAR